MNKPTKFTSEGSIECSHSAHSFEPFRAKFGAVIGGDIYSMPLIIRLLRHISRHLKRVPNTGGACKQR